MSKIMIPIFQRAEDLQLAIVREDVLPVTTTMQACRINYEDWLIDFVIIGESHRIRIQDGRGFFLEEMLACIDIERDSCWHYHDFPDLSEHHYQGDNYCIQTTFLDKIPEQIQSRQYLEFRFPKIQTIQPVTRIEWQFSEDMMRWWTVHSYIEAEKIICVFTQSEFHF